jgi:uncharacterized protein
MISNPEITDIVKEGKTERLAALLEENPDLANIRTEQGISLLQLAAYCRNKVALDLLMKYRVNPDIFESVCIGETGSVRKHLEDNPGLLNAYSADGFTPLGLASFFGQDPIVEILIDQGANVNLPSNNSYRVAPIHSACAISNYLIVERLIKLGADVNAKQMHGVSPLHSAAHNGQTKLAELLINNGANVNAKMDDGQTPLMMAVEKNFTETADLIRKYGGK